VGSAILADIRDPVHHQHGRFGQLRIACAKQLAPGACQQRVLVKTPWKICHSVAWPPIIAISFFALYHPALRACKGGDLLRAMRHGGARCSNLFET
jgi:hypothetical protein